MTDDTAMAFFRQAAAKDGDDIPSRLLNPHGHHVKVNTGYYDNVELVPRHEVLRYASQETDPEHVKEVGTHVATSGSMEPLILHYHPKTSEAYLGEGNHRLRAAKTLQMDHVPVRVTRWNSGLPGPGVKTPQEHPAIAAGTHVPADIKPSDIGFSTLDTQGHGGGMSATSFFRQAAEDHSGPFYHGTAQEFQPGDFVDPSYELGGRKGKSYAFMTSDPETAHNYGKHKAWVHSMYENKEVPGRAYEVRPTGPVEADDTVDDRFKAWRTRHPLQVVREVTPQGDSKTAAAGGYSEESAKTQEGSHVRDAERTAGKGKPRRQPGAGDGAAGAGEDAAGAAPAVGAGQEGPRAVTFHAGAQKELSKLDPQDRKRVAATIDSLATDGPSPQTHPLNGPLKGWSATKASRGHRIVHRDQDDGTLHIGYVGLHDYDTAIRRLTTLDVTATAFFREAVEGGGAVLHRGVWVEADPNDLVEAHERGGMAAVHKHIHGLVANHSKGIGTHWTSDPKIANEFSQGSYFEGDRDSAPHTSIPYQSTMHIPVRMQGHVAPEHHENDHDALDSAMVQGHGWNPLRDRPHERETLVRPGSPVHMTGMQASLPDHPDWVHHINDALGNWEHEEWGHSLKHPHSWQEIGGTGQHTATAFFRQTAGVDDDYRMMHHAPGATGAPLHDPTHAPEGGYGAFNQEGLDNPDWGEIGVPHEESMHAVHRAKGRPDAPVTIYRAAPPDVKHIHSGNWVSTSADYARDHAVQGNGSPDWPVLKATVPAKHVRTDGNDINEWGYHGPTIENAAIHGPDEEWKNPEEGGHHTTSASVGAAILKQAAAETGTGIMVALVPPREIAEQMAREGGEPAEQLHVTMAYLGKTADYTKEQLDWLPELVGSWAARQKPVSARVGGAGKFENGDEHVLWAAVDIPGGAQMHSSLAAFLTGHGYRLPSEHGWTPHLTLAYVGKHFRFLPKLTEHSWTSAEAWTVVAGKWTRAVLGAGPR